MNEQRTKKKYFRKTTIWLSEADDEAIKRLAQEQEISQVDAHRLMLVMGRQNLDTLIKGTNIIFIK